MKYYKKILVFAIVVAVTLIISYGIESYQNLYQIKGKIIRFHVLANSDTLEDQQLKYKVRNKIIEKFDEEFEDVKTKENSEKIIINKIDDIKQMAEETIAAEGYKYNVDVYYGNYKFPRKQYEEIVLPEGNYDAIRIEIGEAKGKNWWCVMFPPLCFVDFGKNKDAEPVFDVDTEKKLNEVLSEEEIELIKTKRGLSDIKLKSKIFELVERGRVGNTGVYAGDGEKTYISTKNK